MIGNPTIDRTGNVLTFTVPITFLTTFEGAQELYALGISSSGDYHPWMDLGSWTVNVPTLNTTANGAGTAQTAMGSAQPDYGNMSVPSVWRTNRTQAAAKVDALASGGMDDFEIPAFLRKQAD
jgi:hypothetical protein